MTKLSHAALYPPEMNRMNALFVFVCSILFPGITQMFVALFHECDIAYFFVGLVQLVAAPVLLGFIWSILWGWNGLRASPSEELPLHV